MTANLTLTNATFNANGKFGQSLSGGYGIATNALSGTKISVAGWVKASAANGQIAVAFGQGDVLWVGMDASGKVVGHFGKNPDVAITPALNIADGAWHYVELCVDSAVGSYLFVDGALVGSNMTASAFDFTTSPYRFGVRIFPYGPASSPNTGFPWPGEVEEVTPYSGVRHTAAYTPPTTATPNTDANLLALYHLDGNGLDSAGLTVPGAPTIGTAVAGDGYVDVAFTAPSSNGGSAVTGYTATLSTGETNTGTVSPIRVTAANGTARTAHVTAMNGVGTGPASAESNSVTPKAATAPNSSTTVVDASIFWSPYNWDSYSGYKSTNNPGAYCKLNFTGTAVAVNLDVSAMVAASLPAASYPIVRTVIDGTSAADVKLTSATTSISRTSLASGSHTLEFYYVATDDNTGDQWSTPVQAIRVTGFSFDSGATVSAPTTRSKNHLHFGDSISRGYMANGTGTAQPESNNALLTVPPSLAQMFDAEYGVVAFSGQGYQQAGNGNVPNVLSAWSYFSSGRSRLASGLLSPAPDYITIELGTNGTTSAANVQALLAALRAAAPQAKIFQMVPRGGINRAPVTTGESAVNDANSYLIDLGTGYQTGLSNYTATANMYSVDGLHPNPLANMRAAAGFAGKIQAAMDGVSQPALTARTVTLTLYTDATTPAANWTGLKVAFYDEPTPDKFSVPRYKSAVQTTNASGVLTFSVQSSLAVGGTGCVIVQTTDNHHYNATVAVS